jgi:hypothetical protein
METAASSTNGWWPNGCGAAPSNTNWLERPTPYNTQSKDRAFGGPSSSLEFVPGLNYENIVPGRGNNRDHSQDASISGPCLGDPPNILSSISYRSIYGQSTHASEFSAIVAPNSFASMPDMAYDTTLNMSLSPFANAFKHLSASPSRMTGTGPRNSGLLPRNNRKTRSHRAPKLAEVSVIKKTQKKQGGRGISEQLKALNILA